MIVFTSRMRIKNRYWKWEIAEMPSPFRHFGIGFPVDSASRQEYSAKTRLLVPGPCEKAAEEESTNAVSDSIRDFWVNPKQVSWRNQVSWLDDDEH